MSFSFRYVAACIFVGHLSNIGNTRKPLAFEGYRQSAVSGSTARWRWRTQGTQGRSGGLVCGLCACFCLLVTVSEALEEQFLWGSTFRIARLLLFWTLTKSKAVSFVSDFLWLSLNDCGNYGVGD